MAIELLLRFRELTNDINTPFEHRVIIDRHGSAWWGWWKKDSEPDRREELKALRDISRKDGIKIGLFDPSAPQYYVATMTDCVFAEFPRPTPSPSHTPEYYNQKKCSAWFKLTGISPGITEEDFVKAFGSIPIGSNTFFLVGDADSTKKSSPVAAGVITLPDGPILHLTDIHFGSDHFINPATKGLNPTSLKDRLIADLKDTPPSLLIISGDLTSRAEAYPLFDQSAQFIRDMQNAFGLHKEQIVIVPGNHDFPLGQWTKYDYSHEKTFLGFLKATLDQAVEYPNLKRFSFPSGQLLEILSINSVRIRHEKLRQFGYVNWSLYRNLLEQAGDQKISFRLAVLHHHLVQSVAVEEVDPADSGASASITVDAGEVAAGLQHFGFDLALHGHQHVPSLNRVTRTWMDPGSHDLVGLQGGLWTFGGGSAGAHETRLSPEMRDNAYALLSFQSGKANIEVRTFNPQRASRLLFRANGRNKGGRVWRCNTL